MHLSLSLLSSSLFLMHTDAGGVHVFPDSDSALTHKKAQVILGFLVTA
jgi:hypothetical protein